MDSVPARVGGFTLIELMIVVAIIAILAAIALPSYRNYVIRGNLVNGTNELSALRAQMEQYYQDARTYSTTGNYTTPCTATYMNGLNVQNWGFACTLGPVASPCIASQSVGYYITATGVSTGPANGFVYIIDGNGNQCTTAVVSSSWGSTPAGHWIMSPGG